jgi:hypothetical protein
MFYEMSQWLETEALVQCWWELSSCCAATMSRMSFSHGVVVTGVSEAPMSCFLGEGRLKLPSPLDVVRNSSVESSIMARRGVDAPLQVEPMKATLVAPLLGERLRPSK